MTTKGQEWPHTRFFPNPPDRHPTTEGPPIGSGIPPLQQAILSYWKMEESPGTNKSDEFSGYTLVETGGNIDSGIGIQGSGIYTNKAQNRYLRNSADEDNFSFQDEDFTIVAWARMEGSRTLNQGVVSKFQDGTNNREFTLFFLTSGGPAGTDKKFRFSTSSDGLDDHSVSMPGAGPEVQLGINYFIVAQRDASTNTLRLTVASGNGTWESRLINTGTGPTGGLFASAAPLDVASVEFGFSPNVWHGMIDEVGIWKRHLPDDQLKNLFNNGDGLTPPFP